MQTMAEAVRRYIAHAGARGLAAGSLLLYGESLEQVARFLRARGRTLVGEVGLGDLEAWAVDLHRLGLSAGVRRSRIFLARRFFAGLKRTGELLHDPAADLEPPRRGEALPKVPPDAEAMARLIRELPEDTVLDLRNRALVLLLYGGMVRIAEAMALDLCDVDLDESTATVRRGKGGRQRVVPLPVQAADALAAYLAARGKLFRRRRPKPGAAEALFVSRRGSRLSTEAARDVLKRIGKAGGLARLHPHLLRHAGALHMLRGQADIRHVQEILGHAQLDTTKAYLCLAPKELKRIYDEAFPVLRV